MSKITRYNGNLKAFASEATGTERTIFGDTAQSDTLDANITMDLLRGWGVIGVASNPTKQHFNGLAFTLGQLIAYLHQRGVPEWNSAQEYYQGSVVTTLVGIYRLKSGGVGSSDPDTDGGVNWELIPTQAKVDAKADKATTYTETEVDGLLDAKADQATTYTETEVDDLIATRTESPDETAVAGTATFTNSTNNIALTGIGSIGLEIGDVVRVTGTASNNKLFTVEVLTDSGNVIVNQAHAGGTTTKSLVDETVSATVTLIAKWFNAPASLGQGWVEVTPSRSLGSNFTNATKRAIQVAVNFTQTGSGSITRSFRINGAAVQKATEFQTGILRTLGAVLVPNADTYGIDSGTGVSLDSWLELR